MDINLNIVPVAELGPNQFSRCKTLTMIGEGLGIGMMQGQLEAKLTTDHAVLAFCNRMMVGWCLVSTAIPPSSRPGWSPWYRYDPSRPVGDAYSPISLPVGQFYVHPVWRRRGVGSAIYRQAEAAFGTLTTMPWDDRSRSFFNSLQSVAQ